MIRSLLLLGAGFLSTVHGQAAAPPNGCLVCGDGKVITEPDAVFEFPNQPSARCDILQSAGLQGLIPLDQCSFLPSLINVCRCEFGDLPSRPISCPEATDEGCSICGDGSCVTNPDNIFTFPDQPSVPCGELQAAGFAGLIPLDSCPLLPQLVTETCGCKTHLTIEPTPVPTQAPSELSIPCPIVPEDGCSVCGLGQCVTDPDAVFSFPDQPSTACGDLEAAGYGGIIPLDQCGFLPGLLGETCSCKSARPADFTLSPSAAPTDSPSSAPSAKPTDAPVTVSPSPAPTDTPSMEPSAKPTDSPIVAPTTDSPIVPPTTESPVVPPTDAPAASPTYAPTKHSTPAVTPTTKPSSKKGGKMDMMGKKKGKNDDNSSSSSSKSSKSGKKGSENGKKRELRHDNNHAPTYQQEQHPRRRVRGYIVV